MARRLSSRQINILVGQVVDVIRVATSHRTGRGPHWVAMSDMASLLQRHGIEIADGDMNRALAMAAGLGLVRLEGDPPHSVAPIMRWIDLS